MSLLCFSDLLVSPPLLPYVVNLVAFVNKISCTESSLFRLLIHIGQNLRFLLRAYIINTRRRIIDFSCQNLHFVHRSIAHYF